MSNNTIDDRGFSAVGGIGTVGFRYSWLGYIFLFSAVLSRLGKINEIKYYILAEIGIGKH